MTKCSGAGSCQTAAGRDCRCACGMANHGAKGRLGWAAALDTDPDGETAQAAIRRQGIARGGQEGRIKTLRQSPVRPTGFTLHDSTPVTEYARTVDAVNWLVAEKAEREQSIDLVTGLGRITDWALDELVGDRGRASKRLADHFWCDVVAAMVVVIEKLGKISRAAEQIEHTSLARDVWSVVEQSRGESKSFQSKNPVFRPRRTRTQLDQLADGVSPDVLEAAAGQLVGVALNVLHAASGLGPACRKLQLLAVLLCPDPARHKLVWDHCMRPMLRVPIASGLQQEIATLVPGLDQPLPHYG